MTKDITTLAIVLFLLAGIRGCRQSDKHDALITVDLMASYHEKELILQDFMDVEYIVLETNNEFVTQGDIMAIGNKHILVKNLINDGDIFIFDRKTGKGLRKINRKGRGGEEYNSINGIVLDEDNNEIFVNSSSTKKILVYDLFGNFKRSIIHTEGAQYLVIFNYDKDNLICYDMSGYYKVGESRGNQSFHVIISKQDGSVTRKISIPFNVIKAPVVQEGNGFAMTYVSPIIPYHDNWLLVETSSDTIYKYMSKENKLTPFLVKNSTIDTEIFLTMGTIDDRFYFMRTLENVFDFTKGRGFPTTDLMYDIHENAVFNPTIISSDYVKNKTVDMTLHPVNSEIAAFQNLEANQLVEAYEKNELKGKLKEIAAELHEGSNPVIMVMKYKR